MFRSPTGNRKSCLLHPCRVPRSCARTPGWRGCAADPGLSWEVYRNRKSSLSPALQARGGEGEFAQRLLQFCRLLKVMVGKVARTNCGAIVIASSRKSASTNACRRHATSQPGVERRLRSNRKRHPGERDVTLFGSPTGNCKWRLSHPCRVPWFGRDPRVAQLRC